ncbi:MAG TPA: hypothetical protein VHB70_19395, partial [Parafilimonas sp.]|nr:hypothetical protein [Parafilimonas sp.]
DLNKIQPPFKSDLPKTFPTNKETDKLKFSYDEKDFKKHYRSQNDILDSMITEYGRGTGHYGDFGRYVFESALSDWRVNANGLSNLAIKWIFEKYGYDVEKHGEFDRTIGSGRGRENSMEERIGKKYQWIAFYEILARVSDNYPFYEDSYNDDAKQIKYEGPWEPYVRDIDPTMIIKTSAKDKSKLNWWNPISYSNWKIPNKDWVFLTNDLPNPISFINVTDNEACEWLVLEMYPSWNEPTPLGEEKYHSPHKRLFYNLSSHVVHKEDLKTIIKYLTKRNLRGSGLLDISRRYEMFSREYYWAAANKTFSSKYHGGNQWDEVYDRKSGKFVCNTARTAIQFLWEEEFDASKEETISFYKPTEMLFTMFDMQYSKVEGQLLNKTGDIICFDPSASIPSISCLLIKKSDLLKKLAENDLEILWTSVGEKLIIGGHHNRKEWVGRLNISDVVYFDKGQLKSTSYYEKE